MSRPTATTEAGAIAIRPVAEKEVALLKCHLARGFPSKHRARFARQAPGEAGYLTAWHGDVPVGHVLMEWGGVREEPIRSRLRPCPVLSDLFVTPRMRSAGIGSRLPDAAERSARDRGHRRIALGIATGSPAVRSLYERRG